jgi:ABC-type bacteriocin/lantibiotic exporter with double-glycine peptidase domain
MNLLLLLLLPSMDLLRETVERKKNGQQSKQASRTETLEGLKTVNCSGRFIQYNHNYKYNYMS